MYFSCEKNCGLYLTLHELKKLPSSELSYSEIQNRVAQLDTEFHQFQQQLSLSSSERVQQRREVKGKVGEREMDASLHDEVMRGKDEIARLQQEVADSRDALRRFMEEGREEKQLGERVVREQENVVSQLHRQVVEQAEENVRAMTGLRNTVREQAENHAMELQQVRQDLEGYHASLGRSKLKGDSSHIASR